MIFVAETKDGERIEYRDTKRYLWLISLATPFIPQLALIAYFWFGLGPASVFLPFILTFVMIPLLDFLIGEDHANPPPEIVEKMAEDQYYRKLLLISVPLFWMNMLLCAWFVGTQELPWWAVLMMAVNAGYSAGTAITVGHELGHKTNKTDRLFALLANSVSGYAHFCVEHNKGHHTWVATPEDPASARFNESVYAFAMREIPGAFRRGWEHEKERLKRKGLALFSWHNEILRGYTLTLLASVVLIAIFGWVICPISFFTILLVGMRLRRQIMLNTMG